MKKKLLKKLNDAHDQIVAYSIRENLARIRIERRNKKHLTYIG